MPKNNLRWFRRGAFGNSINVAVALIVVDVVCLGSYLFSGIACPIWLLVSLARSIIARQDWRVAIVRASFPVGALTLVLANYFLQERIAADSAASLIAACEKFRDETGNYPDRLTQLVPLYLRSIPRSKYCLCCNNFSYDKSADYSPIIWWCEFPPFGKRVYNFGTHKWRSLD